MRRSSVMAVAVVAALTFAACGSDKKATKPTTAAQGKFAGVVVSTVPQLETVLTTLVRTYNNKANPKLLFRPVVADSVAVVAGLIAKNHPGAAVLPDTALKNTKLGANETKGTFGRDVAVIAVPTANPHHVSDLKAFAATSGLRISLCGPRTGFGNVPLALLAMAHIIPVKGAVAFDCEAKVLGAIAKGTLDAALLYRGGLTVPSGVKLVTVPTAQNFIVGYSDVLVGTAPKVAAFGKFLASPTAKAILTRNGYLP